MYMFLVAQKKNDYQKVLPTDDVVTTCKKITIKIVYTRLTWKAGLLRNQVMKRKKLPNYKSGNI